MENLETVENDNRNELVLEAQAEVYFRETRKWAKFLAIVGFIFMGLLALLALIIFVFSSSMESITPFPMSILGFIYLFVAVLYCIPIYYLFQFSNKARIALDSKNTQTLTESMMYLKSHYKFLGIFTIVMLALYPLLIIGAIIFGASQCF